VIVCTGRSRDLRRLWGLSWSLALLGGQAGAQVPPPPALPPPASPLHLEAAAFAHVDWVVLRQASRDELDPATGASLNEERVLLRRARLRLDAVQGAEVGRGQGAVLGRAEVDLNSVRGLEVRPFDVEVGLGWAAEGPVHWVGAGRETQRGPTDRPLALLASVGLMPIPFGFDATEAPTVRPLLERTRVVRALFPGQRDLGARVDAEFQWLRGSLAILEGTPIGEASADAVDRTARKDLVGHLGVDAAFSSVVRREEYAERPLCPAARTTARCRLLRACGSTRCA
jgi:hypothetical protein